jgi:hypothetical protein
MTGKNVCGLLLLFPLKKERKTLTNLTAFYNDTKVSLGSLQKN